MLSACRTGHPRFLREGFIQYLGMELGLILLDHNQVVIPVIDHRLHDSFGGDLQRFPITGRV